tara:strand:- start:834 stop:2444 length:1611 start_codon:yes stop_codon:yes gene_type:complete
MSYLTKLAFQKCVEVIKVTTKMEISIQDLIDKFRNQCPPRDELLQIVRQKNQVQEGLEQVVSAFDSVNTVAETTTTLVNSISNAVEIIKAIPFPTSTPPGLGIPINVLTLLSDSLDKLGFLLKQTEGAISVIPIITNQITNSASVVILRLQELDVLFNTCLEELVTDEELSPLEVEELIVEVGNIAATSGDFDNPTLNSENDQALLDRLSPNSTNPYSYKGFTFKIQYEPTNPFSFPSRRIQISYKSNDPQEIYYGVSFYNLIDGGYSYSTSVKILINEAKFRTDNLDYNYWWGKWNDRQEALLLGTGEDLLELEDEIDNIQPPGTITTLPNNQTNFPSPITLSTQTWSNWNNLGTTDANFQSGMYSPNLYKNISHSIDIGRSLQISKYRANVEGLSDFGGMSKGSSIRLIANVKVPNSEIVFTIDTGEFTPNQISDSSPTAWGRYTKGIDSKYNRGRVEVKINAASGSEYQNIKLLTVQKEVKTYKFTYPEIGTYYIEATVWNGESYKGISLLNLQRAINANQSSSLIVSYNNQP